ncbi:MAG: hypothetical protein N4A71_07975 [Carboxylicivirga sp.]|jgi:hypothetical protein|nr:hypothetical protein [Carboxylicivirga sp.]
MKTVLIETVVIDSVVYTQLINGTVYQLTKYSDGYHDYINIDDTAIDGDEYDTLLDSDNVVSIEFAETYDLDTDLMMVYYESIAESERNQKTVIKPHYRKRKIIINN